jgi:hypothetical protein
MSRKSDIMHELAKKNGMVVTYQYDDKGYTISLDRRSIVRTMSVDETTGFIYGWAAHKQLAKATDTKTDPSEERLQYMRTLAATNALKVTVLRQKKDVGYEVLCNECVIASYNEVEQTIAFIHGWAERTRIAKNAEYKDPLSWDGYNPNSVDRLSALEKSVSGCISNGECLARSLHAMRMEKVDNERAMGA